MMLLIWGGLQRGKWVRVAGGLAMVALLLIAGCTPQASYMRKWQPTDRIANRWAGGIIRADRLSDDEAVVYEELGTPDTIRLYRQVPTRERVYAWIYEESNQVIWFVEGQRVAYVEVDKNTLPLSRASRQTLRQKAVAGGILAGTIGAFATGFVLLGEDVGLRN
ncbi:hypothetical protein [Candidatus Entotheonella palauensis]|nr:hypothetical protein [Candidatus Entotheonella palauensis]